ncbi:hypothetical protein KKD49_06415 [Myxococcota bacterium]|nr:hypothetical protein [Myxococcota bacterium]
MNSPELQLRVRMRPHPFLSTIAPPPAAQWWTKRIIQFSLYILTLLLRGALLLIVLPV